MTSQTFEVSKVVDWVRDVAKFISDSRQCWVGTVCCLLYLGQVAQTSLVSHLLKSLNNNITVASPFENT